jgi:hypothetical protein
MKPDIQRMLSRSGNFIFTPGWSTTRQASLHEEVFHEAIYFPEIRDVHSKIAV